RAPRRPCASWRPPSSPRPSAPSHADPPVWARRSGGWGAGPVRSHLVSVISLRTASVDATRDLGAALAELLRGGDLVVLAGDLGAGKTALTQGIGRGLGVTDTITSPTFTLAH